MSNNEWFERGELPPVDVQCMNGKHIVQIVAHLFNGENKYAAFQHVDGNGCGYSQANYFRPLKTERERAIEEIHIIANQGSSCASIGAIEKLYDAGFRKTEV